MGSLIDIKYMVNAFPEILRQTPVTLLITVVAMIFGLFIGLIIAIIRLYKIPVLKWIASFYISFTRGTPLLVQIYLSYYGLPKLLTLINYSIGLNIDISRAPSIIFIFVAFSLNTGAYLSETIRSAIEAVDKGQIEASYSVGMTRMQCLFRIQIPQAISIALPNFGNTFISLMKDTSLAFVIAVAEIIGQAKIVGARSLRFFEVYIDAAIIYWILCIVTERGVHMLEKRSKRFKGDSL